MRIFKKRYEKYNVSTFIFTNKCFLQILFTHQILFDNEEDELLCIKKLLTLKKQRK